MPRLKFRTSRRGPGYHYPAGAVVDVPEQLAERFITEAAAIETTDPPTHHGPCGFLYETDLREIIARQEQHIARQTA